MWNFHLSRQGRPIEPMPPEMRDRTDAVYRYLSFLVNVLTAGLIVVLLHDISLSATRIGLHLDNWKYDSLIGLIAGMLLMAVQRLMLGLVPIDPHHPFTSHVQKGSPLLWISILTAAAFSEELWVAVCLVLLKTTGHSVAVSVAMTVIVFGAMHYAYGFGGIVAVATNETISALLFLHYESLIVTIVFHFIGNMGSLYWNRYWRR
jgi:hypothetical protein